MKVLMISSDANILKENSEVRQRMIEYGELFKRLDIIVFSKQTTEEKMMLSENTFVYPTNSSSKANYFFDALNISRKIVRPDVVTAQDPFEIGVVANNIAKYFRCQLHIQVHTDFLSKSFKMESLKNNIRTHLAKYILPKADSIRVVSKKIKDSLGKMNLRVEPIVLPIFVDEELIKNTEIKFDLHEKYKEFDFIILMASRLTKEKNIGLAIDFMHKFVKEYPKTGLVVVGDGPERERINMKVDKLDLNDNVKIEGWSMDLPSYYKTADLFLLTSNYEGYGRTITESLSAGTAVISTDVGAAKELGAFVVDANVSSLAEEVKAFLGKKNKDVTLNNPYNSKKEYLELFKRQFD